MAREKILVTGGLGFIGSHTAVELINAGYETIIVDSLVNSELFILDRIKEITGIKPLFYQFDLVDKTSVQDLFRAQKDINVVIHFAAYKAVGESVKQPLKYFINNITSLFNLLEVMEMNDAHRMVFSSSATVYGQPDELPVKENASFKKALSAYGSTKQMGEEILEKVSGTGKIQTIALRYFNPVGAHPSGLIGELPRGIPNNLMPFLTQTAIGKRSELSVFGSDYNTPDGTAIRDYIHVVDLAKAHVKACDRLLQNKCKENFEVFNIGTGKGHSVLEVISTFERVNNVKVPYRIGEKREGDAEKNYADAGFAKLKIVSDYAVKANKLAAFTETGLESIPNTTWWSETLLKTLKRGELHLCYVLVWRNDIRSPTHYYAPFPGQVSEDDFKFFYKDPYTLFESDLKNIYNQ